MLSLPILTSPRIIAGSHPAIDANLELPCQDLRVAGNEGATAEVSISLCRQKLLNDRLFCQYLRPVLSGQ